MLVIIGAIVVTLSVLGGFMMAGGKPLVLIQPSEFVVILGAAGGSLVIMAPMNVLKGLVAQILACLKPSPFTKGAYEDMFKALYELFMLGRRNGMIALEPHVSDPHSSTILSKYPAFASNHHAVDLLTGALRPLIDGKVKPDQLETLINTELAAMEEEHHKPIDVLTKASDAMPGFGIVAAVLGIVVTMGSIGGPAAEIGHHVAAALVGTFLGILVSYGYLSPITVTMTLNGQSEMGFFRTLSKAVTGFATGMAPIMAIEVARRGLPSDIKPTADELENMLKGIGK
jgi:chemotaxis protein MotA